MDKIPGGEIKLRGEKAQKLENFWYYHKWKVIIGVLASVVLTICFIQSCNVTKSDMTVLYAGPYISSKSETEDILRSLSFMLPEDINGDGEKNVTMSSMKIYSDEDMEKRQEEGYYINPQENYELLKSYDSMILASEYYLCFIDPFLYERTLKMGGFTPLSEVFGADNIPESAIDGYAIKLSETYFGKNFAGVSALPDDTLICLKIRSSVNVMAGSNKSEKIFDTAKAYFKAIVEYTN